MELAQINDMVIAHEERLENLEGWQKKQNGSLQRMEQKMDKIYIALIGLMGGVITALILLVINLRLNGGG